MIVLLLITLHVQREWVKLIGVGVHIRKKEEKEEGKRTWLYRMYRSPYSLLCIDNCKVKIFRFHKLNDQR